MPPKRKREGKRGVTVKAASSNANSSKASGGDGDGDDDNAADDDTTNAGVGGPKKKKIKMKNDEQNQQPTPTNKADETTTTEQTCTPPPPPKTCPYLSFVNRPLLDFDFEKRCSVSFAKENCYCCLTCGHFSGEDQRRRRIRRVGTRKPLRVHALGKWQSVLSSR